MSAQTIEPHAHDPLGLPGQALARTLRRAAERGDLGEVLLAVAQQDPRVRDQVGAASAWLDYEAGNRRARDTTPLDRHEVKQFFTRPYVRRARPAPQIVDPEASNQ